MQTIFFLNFDVHPHPCIVPLTLIIRLPIPAFPFQLSPIAGRLPDSLSLRPVGLGDGLDLHREELWGRAHGHLLPLKVRGEAESKKFGGEEVAGSQGYGRK